MIQRPLCLFIGIITVMAVSAQEKISIKINDQYESRIDSVLVVNAGNSAWYQTDKTGMAVITYNPADSVTFSAPSHNATSLPGPSLETGMLVTVNKKFNWKDLVNPMFYIVYEGLWLLLFIVFAETGLFAGFFLPGDSLLFVAGIYSGNLSDQFFKNFGMADINSEWIGLFVLLALISVAGIFGNVLGFWTGRKIGPCIPGPIAGFIRKDI
jgi:membrane-associated protein